MHTRQQVALYIPPALCSIGASYTLYFIGLDVVVLGVRHYKICQS